MKPLLTNETRFGKHNYYNKEQRKWVRQLYYLKKTTKNPIKSVMKINGLLPSQRMRIYEFRETYIKYKLESVGIKP